MKFAKIAASKKGVASLYVVIFATILFGVITLSFIRIILSETIQGSNDDLSQSAYDSAMAGVEDAKIAVNQYYQCLSNPSQSGCSEIIDGSKRLFGGNCNNFYLRDFLGRGTEDEVKIQESNSNNSDQAYTCVILSNTVPDYRSTLTSDTRTRVVPLGIGSAEKLKLVKKINFRWYSQVNGTVFDRLDHGGKLKPLNSQTIPPTISLSLIKTPATINLDSFNTDSDVSQATVILLPVEDTNTQGTNEISANSLNEAASAGSVHNPYQIKCKHEEFACSVTLNVDFAGATGADGSIISEPIANAMLVVSLPYGDTVTDFAVELLDEHDKTIDFENVQVSVDSTGRANQLVRRVEVRLDPADLFFPYPQYEVELSGGPNETLMKNFWVTQNCWYYKNKNDNNKDEGSTCKNNGEL